MKCFAVGDETKVRRAFELSRIVKWLMMDLMILSIYVKEGIGEMLLVLSVDVKMIVVFVDVLMMLVF